MGISAMSADAINPSSDARQARFRMLAQVILFSVCAIIAVAWIAGVHQFLNDPNFEGEALDTDFSVFWAAARLAIDGQWLAPFDTATLTEWRKVPPDSPDYEMIWFYPPGYLLAIWPLGHLSFFWAWLAFCAVSLAIFIAAVIRPAREVPGAMMFLCCAPMTMLVLALGQNPLIFCALMVLSLEAIRRDQAILAGLALAAMTLKPQLGLAIPFALIAAGHWRVFFWASGFTAVLVGATIVFPGPDYWHAFLTGIAEGSERLRQGDLDNLMLSTYGSAAVIGFPDAVALSLQAAVSVIALAVVCWIWRSNANFDIKAAALCVGTLLVTPYAIYYELMFALAGMLFLIRGIPEPPRSVVILALLVWLAPVLGITTRPDLGFSFTAPLLMAALFLIARFALQRPAT